MNIKVEELKQNIIEQLNNSGLPIAIIYYLMKDILSMVEIIYRQEITKEQEQQIEERKKEID